MRANSKVAILVVSMFLLTALAPAAALLCGSEASDAAGTTKDGVTNPTVTIYTEETTDYSNLVYMSEKLPTSVDSTTWVYDQVEGYWVNSNIEDSDYGKILTYGKFSMSNEEIRQDIIDMFYSDDIINENGTKYGVIDDNRLRIDEEKYLLYSIDSDKVVTLSGLSMGGVSIQKAFDSKGSEIDISGVTSYDRIIIKVDGTIAIYDGATEKTLPRAATMVSIDYDGVTYYLQRNIDPSIAKFQFMQITFTDDVECNLRIKVEKTTAPTYDNTEYLSMTFAGCYFSKMEYSRILIIDHYSGDIRPDEKEVGGQDYKVTIEDGLGNSYHPQVTLDNRDLVVYGTVTDVDGSISGSTVNNALYGATVNYTIVSGNETTTGTASVAYADDDETGDVKGFYRITVPYEATLDITDVICDDYSFIKKTYSYGMMKADVLPKEGQEKMHIFSAEQKTAYVTIKDLSDAPAIGCTVEAVWWYEYNGMSSLTYPLAEGKAGTVSSTSVTDSSGNARIAYSLPTGTDTGFEYALYIKAVDKVKESSAGDPKSTIYSFTVDDTSEWTKGKLPTTLSGSGNVFLVASSATTGSLIKANEYSFTTTVLSKNGVPVDAASIKAMWYYREDLKNNSTGVSFTVQEGESVGRVNIVNNTSDDSGKIRVIYSAPVFTAYHWLVVKSTYIYIYGNANSSLGYTYTYVDEKTIESLAVDPDVSASPGCELISYDTSVLDPAQFSEQNYDIAIDSNLWAISGEITSGSGDLPDWVILTVNVPESETAIYEFTINQKDGKLEYKFYLIEGRTPKLTVSRPTSDYYFVISPYSPGEILKDTSVSFKSYYVGTQTTERTALVPIGVTSGYIVNGLDDGTVLVYTYVVEGNNHSTYVKADSGKTTLTLNGRRSGLSVNMSASDSTGVYYVPSFNEYGTADAYKLKETKNVLYNKDTDHLLADITITVYYNGLEYGEFTTDENGEATYNVPNNNVTYEYNGHLIEYTTSDDSPYKGYLRFDLDKYLDGSISRSVTVTVEYYVSSSLENVSAATCKPIVYSGLEPVESKVDVGTTCTFTAPSLDGFSFAGWYYNGQYYSSEDNSSVCKFMPTGDMDDNVTLMAIYSANSYEEPQKGIDTTVMIVGIIAVVIAVLALVYVVFQNKRF